MKPYGFVYHLFNTANGKSYVGQTTMTVERRWKSHLKGSRNPHFPIQHAIQKYGSDAFVCTTLVVCSSKEELDQAEVYWGTHFDCLVPDGYSLKLGNGVVVSGETRRRISEARKNQKNVVAGFKGKKHSPEALLKMSESRSGRVYGPGWRTQTPESKAKISASLKGKKKPPGFGAKVAEANRRRSRRRNNVEDQKAV